MESYKAEIKSIDIQHMDLISGLPSTLTIYLKIEDKNYVSDRINPCATDSGVIESLAKKYGIILEKKLVNGGYRYDYLHLIGKKCEGD